MFVGVSVTDGASVDATYNVFVQPVANIKITPTRKIAFDLTSEPYSHPSPHHDAGRSDYRDWFPRMFLPEGFGGLTMPPKKRNTFTVFLCGYYA